MDCDSEVGSSDVRALSGRVASRERYFDVVVSLGLGGGRSVGDEEK